MKNTNSLVWSLTSVVGLVSAAPLLQAQNTKSEKPNVIIILADDMGYGDVSLNNAQARTHTPNIDKLAASGLRFTDAHAGGAVSTPSRYALMTGRYFFRTPRQESYWGYLPPLIERGRETIGSLMQKADYETACVGKWHLGLNWSRKDDSKPQIENANVLGFTNTNYHAAVTGGPNDLGFNYSFILPASLDMPPYVFMRNGKAVDPQILLTADAYPNRLDRTEYAWDRKHTKENDVYWDRGVWWRNGEMSESFKVEDCFDTIVDEGVHFIKKHVAEKGRQPFMLYLPLTGPHTPWMPSNDFKGSSSLGTYGDFISQVDHVVFRINEIIKQLNLDDNTMIIFSSDNGSAWQEEDIQAYGHQSNGHQRGQKGDAWEGGHHIPLFIKWPAKIKQPLTYTHTVSLIDLLATFADMTGEKIEEPYAEDSYSFYDVLCGNVAKPTRDHLIYIASSGVLSIKKEEWKFIDCLGSGGFTAPSIIKPVPNGPEGQLYNLKEDCLEHTNLYFEKPDKVKELSRLLHQLRTQGFSKQ